MGLKELRMKNNLTQAELGKRINRKQVTISQYETGLRKPDIHTVKSMAKVLNVSVEKLIDEIDK